ncbi:toxin B, partial [Escherichia coli]|nr:toxin B [Escherichia coli]
MVWYNSVMEKNVFLREVISCVLRSKKVDSYINENKKNLSKEDAGALRDYAKLKMKELFSMLDDDGYKKIITTNAYI